MSTPPAGAPVSAAVAPLGGAPTGAPAGGGPSWRGSFDTVPGQVVQARDVADLIAEAVLAVPGVAGLHGGPFGTVATYLPGRRVSGVAVRTDTSRAFGDPQRELVEVSVIAAAERGLRTDLRALAARVRTAVKPLVRGPVSITIADLEEPSS